MKQRLCTASPHATSVLSLLSEGWKVKDYVPPSEPVFPQVTWLPSSRSAAAASAARTQEAQAATCCTILCKDSAGHSALEINPFLLKMEIHMGKGWLPCFLLSKKQGIKLPLQRYNSLVRKEEKSLSEKRPKGSAMKAWQWLMGGLWLLKSCEDSSGLRFCILHNSPSMSMYWQFFKT